MRKLNYLFLFIFFGTLVGCNQNSNDDLESLENGAMNAKPGSDVKIFENYTGKIGECGETVYEFKAGSNSMDAGDVIVSYDETNLYVKVTSTSGFQDVAENVKMWIGTDLNDLPTSNGSGAPINGQFPYKANVSGNIHVFQIALADIDAGLDCDEPFFIVVHGDVLVEYNGQTSAQTAYAGDKEGAGNRWWWYMEETVECCDDLDIAFLYKEGYPNRVSCYTFDSGQITYSGFSNRYNYSNDYVGGISYPVYSKINDCSVENVENVGIVKMFLLDYDNDNAKIVLEFKGNPGFNVSKWIGYVGWTNPVLEGNFKEELNNNMFEVDVVDGIAKIEIDVDNWHGDMGDGGMDGESIFHQYFLMSQFRFTKE